MLTTSMAGRSNPSPNKSTLTNCNTSRRLNRRSIVARMASGVLALTTSAGTPAARYAAANSPALATSTANVTPSLPEAMRM